MFTRIREMLSGNKINVAKISFGSIAGNLITLVTFPINARIYGSVVIGMWTVLYAAVSVINSFSDFGLSNTIMIDQANSAERTYRVVTTLSLILSIGSSVLVSLLYFITSEFNELSLFFVFLTLAFSAFTSQQIQICSTWLNRDGRYDVLMKNPIITAATYGTTAIVLGILFGGAYSYFVAHMIAQATTLFHMKRHLPRRAFSFSKFEVTDTLKSNKRFVIYQMPTNVIANFKNQLPVFLINIFWGKEIVGFYSVSVRIVQLPISILANAIGRVYFQTVSAMKREGRTIGEYTLKNLKRGMRIAAIPMAALIALGDVVVVLFFGEEWLLAGNLLRILVLQYFFMFLLMTTRGLYMTLQKQNYAMVSTISQALGFLLGAAVGKYVFGSIYTAVFLMTGFFVGINIVFFCSLFRVMKMPVKKYLENVTFSLLVILSMSSLIRLIMMLFGVVESFI